MSHMPNWSCDLFLQIRGRWYVMTAVLDGHHRFMSLHLVDYIWRTATSLISNCAHTRVSQTHELTLVRAQLLLMSAVGPPPFCLLFW